jgi:hypothetical protein
MVFEVLQIEDGGYFMPNWVENNEEKRKMAMI